LKTHVFVLVPFSVGPSALLAEADKLIERHRRYEDGSGSGRFDYLVGPTGSFDDPIAEGRLPTNVRRALHRRVCDVEHLPADLVPAALVTPDGKWHDLAEHGWRMVNEPSQSNKDALVRWSFRYRKLVAENPYCWVVEFWAHS
jgi:hypothetical protein